MRESKSLMSRERTYHIAFKFLNTNPVNFIKAKDFITLQVEMSVFKQEYAANGNLESKF